ncbi:MAG: flagellar hook-length control protein FliK, partial [Proteobacteria bacterium]|nr:flagellar hook-length control protein FliK [Candidatus Avisuccinivibrio stercorigallinarum]
AAELEAELETIPAAAEAENAAPQAAVEDEAEIKAQQPASDDAALQTAAEENETAAESVKTAEQSPAAPAAQAAQSTPAPAADFELPAEEPSLKAQQNAAQLQKLYQDSAQHAAQTQLAVEAEPETAPAHAAPAAEETLKADDSAKAEKTAKDTPEDEPEIKQQSTISDDSALKAAAQDAETAAEPEQNLDETVPAPAVQTAPLPADLEVPEEEPAIKPQPGAADLHKLYQDSAQHAAQAETEKSAAMAAQGSAATAPADDAAKSDASESEKLQQLYTRPAAAETEAEPEAAEAAKAHPAVTAAAEAEAAAEAKLDAAKQAQIQQQQQSAAAQSSIELPQPEIDPETLLQPAVVSPGTNPENAEFAARAPESSMPLPEMKEQSLQPSLDPRFKELYQGALGSMGVPQADAEGDANALLKQTLSAEADAADDAVSLSSGRTPAHNLQSGILDGILSTVPSDDFKDEHEILKAEQAKEAQVKAVQTEALQDAAQQRQVMSAPLTAPAAAAVLQGGSGSVPETTEVKVKQAKEGGFFKKLASLFTGSKSAQPAVPLMDDSQEPPNVSAGPGDPLQKMMHDLKRALTDPNLPPELKQQGADFMHKLNQPVNDLAAVQSWLNFVVSPFTPNTSQALALHQWAFMILCIRFSQLGRDISTYLEKCKKDDPKLAASIEKAVSASAKQSSTSVTALIDDTFAQTQRLQQLADQGGIMQFFNNYVPLPPQYEGGSEGGFNLRQDSDADGKDVWHLNFFFDLKDLGPIQIKAEAKLPELFLHIVTDNLDALQQVQQMLPLLQKKLQEFGVTTRESNVRLGHVFMPTASFKSAEDELPAAKSQESSVFSVNV